MKLSEPIALNRAAAYCSKAERCAYDVKKKLQGWELDPDAIARVIKRLENEKFISDERFCRSFIKDKLRFNKWGKVKIVYELKKKQISDSIYKPILDEYSPDEFDEQLFNILKIKGKSVKAKNVHEKRTKLIRFALGRGFPMDSCLKVVNNLMGNNYDEDID